MTAPNPANSAAPIDPGRSFHSMLVEGTDDDTEQLPRLPKKAGRPGRPLDHNLTPEDTRGWETLDGLLRLQCTLQEVAAFFGRGEDWVRDRVKTMHDMTFAAYADTIRPLGMIGVRRKQLQLAMAGDRQMLIFLGQNLLGQSTKAQTALTGKDGGPIQTEDVTDPARIVMEGLATIAARQKVAHEARAELAQMHPSLHAEGPQDKLPREQQIKVLENPERANMETIQARVHAINTPKRDDHG